METFGHKTVTDGSNSSKEKTESGNGRGRVGVVRSVPTEGGSPSRRVRPIPPPRTGNAAPAAVANRGNRLPQPARVSNVGRNLGGGDGSSVRVNAPHPHVVVAGHVPVAGEDYERKVEDTLEGACDAFAEL